MQHKPHSCTVHGMWSGLIPSDSIHTKKSTYRWRDAADTTLVAPGDSLWSAGSEPCRYGLILFLLLIRGSALRQNLLTSCQYETGRFTSNSRAMLPLRTGPNRAFCSPPCAQAFNALLVALANKGDSITEDFDYHRCSLCFASGQQPPFGRINNPTAIPVQQGLNAAARQARCF